MSVTIHICYSCARTILQYTEYCREVRSTFSISPTFLLPLEWPYEHTLGHSKFRVMSHESSFSNLPHEWTEPRTQYQSYARVPDQRIYPYPHPYLRIKAQTPTHQKVGFVYYFIDVKCYHVMTCKRGQVTIKLTVLTNLFDNTKYGSFTTIQCHTHLWHL